MITLDSSAIIATLDSRDPDHTAIVEIVDEEIGSLIVPAVILSEVAYFVEHRMGQPSLAALITDIVAGRYTLDYDDRRWPRILELVRRYRDLPLGLADAAMIECAERHGGKVLTLDRRHFGVVEREGTIQILP